MRNEKTISVLNSLIEINNDRIKGYELALKETHEADMKELFSVLIETSGNCIEELILEVKRIGGKASEETKTSGKIFAIWMDFKTSLNGYDRKAILGSCERAEAVAVALYEKILQEQPSETLSSEETRMVYGQYRILKADHDKMIMIQDTITHLH